MGNILRIKVDGESPMFLAIRESNAETLQLYLDDGQNANALDAETGISLLHYAIMYDEPECVYLLLTQRANVHSVCQWQEFEWTPMHCAAQGGNVAIVNMLLHFGGQVNCINRLGFTPLHCAIVMHRAEALQQLLYAGAIVQPDHVNQVRTTTKKWLKSNCSFAVLGNRYGLL